ncbi:MAG: replication initiator protein A [Clostridium sp.]|uniref:replication initiator protein A n=1 Tax=Clostridium sp. TaxID=1506 RepID=UPI0030303973
MGNFMELNEENIDKESFGTFPHALYRLEKYRQVLSNDSILLYGILKDRLNLSFRNNMRDKYGKVFIIASLDCICKKLNVSVATARKIVRELESVGLLRIEKFEGYNASRRFYLGAVIREETAAELEVEVEQDREIKAEKKTRIVGNVEGLEDESGQNSEVRNVDKEEGNKNYKDEEGKLNSFSDESLKNQNIETSTLDNKIYQEDKRKIDTSGDKNYPKGESNIIITKGEKINPNKPDLNKTDFNNPDNTIYNPEAEKDYKNNYSKSYSKDQNGDYKKSYGKGNYKEGYKKNYYKEGYNNPVNKGDSHEDNFNYGYLKAINLDEL